MSKLRQSESAEDVQVVAVSVESAVLSLMVLVFTRVNGVGMCQMLTSGKLFVHSGLNRVRSDRNVDVLRTSPGLREIGYEMLGCPPDRQPTAHAIAHWDAFYLEGAAPRLWSPAAIGYSDRWST